MSTGIWILIVIVALLAGLALGFFGARRYMEKYIRENPPISEDQMRTMMMQMGQRPSEKKLRQMMNSMKQQQSEKR
ncbi:YneF family protein [Secundilactobacillus silagei]|uniref:UPF0154 protein IWT126_01742 n=1 Tax=Secundilactobacillus silagei JCM 19001 TaxID=1302250 RepID=A0A1Z5IJ35_9LACO|nr:YneF family protein [Secundilactobacillus silagei]TDG71029.1 hypothetical protein C5L25_001217 [Secundilactobacillus silagei JCM 19001]GAX01699.1 hypothetical protein IWT126_01742 [Secundilactobacillus silagei JCM 19001]